MVTDQTVVLSAQAGPVDLGGPVVSTWTYGGVVPGREIRVRAGDVVEARLVITITTGLVDTSSTPVLLRMLAADRIDPARFVTHRFPLDEMPAAYEVFSQPQQSGALKVVLTR